MGKVFIALALLAVCSAAPIGDEHHDHHHDHHHTVDNAVHAISAETARNAINANGAESALEVKEAHAAAFAYGSRKALMAKKAENAENAKFSENAKYAMRARNAKFADWAAHAKHISPTFPPRPHEIEAEDDGSWIEEYLEMLPEKKDAALAAEDSNDLVAMKAKNAINAVYSGGASKAIFASKHSWLVRLEELRRL